MRWIFDYQVDLETPEAIGKGSHLASRPPRDLHPAGDGKLT
jgi:hypothetical protein